MTTLNVTSREICRMLAGGDDPERLRQKAARLNHWNKAGFFEALGYGPLNPGVGRGGALEYPPEAKAYAALFDEMAEAGVTAYEAMLITGGFGVVDEGAVGRAMSGEQDIWMFWQMLSDGSPRPDQIPIRRRFSTSPVVPTEWTSCRCLHLTRVFARAREE
jgi:hypothetical protein